MSVWRFGKKRADGQPTIPVSTRPEPPIKTPPKTIEIKIELPSIANLPKYTSMKRVLFAAGVSRKKAMLGGVLGAVAIVSIGSYYLLLTEEGRHITASGASSADSADSLVRGTPDYPTVLPSGKKIEELGGWTRVSPQSSNPVFAYVDKVGGVAVNVSQQPLPDEFKDDTAEQIKALAQSFKANEEITVGNTTFYIGSSAKGPQSVIFSKDDLLVLMKSSVRIKSTQWTEYVNSLQ
jgi:hypothetical protein